MQKQQIIKDRIYIFIAVNIANSLRNELMKSFTYLPGRNLKPIPNSVRSLHLRHWKENYLFSGKLKEDKFF
jgi:hypothetical protein